MSSECIVISDDESDESVIVLQAPPAKKDTSNKSEMVNDEFERLKQFETCKKDFPEEFSYLLEMPTINEKELKRHPDLYSLLFTKQKTEKGILDREFAFICLDWAQEINQCSRPLLKNITIENEDLTTFGKKNIGEKARCKLTFGIMYDTENCLSSKKRSVKKGIYALVKASETQKMLARVSHVEFKYCQVVIKCAGDETSKYLKFDNVTADVYEIPQDLVPMAMIKSAQKMKAGHLNQVVVPKPRFTEKHKDYLKRKSDEMSKFVEEYNVSDSLTPSQLDAVFAICNKEHGACPFVLFGPPGTGKTYTISHAVQTIVKMNDTNRILICTSSNAASDRVAEQLMDDFGDVLDNANVLRMRSPGNDYNQRQERFDEICFINHENQTYAIPKAFERWRVVISTLGCSSHIASNDYMSGFFSHIIIDEAGQTTEGEMWIPLGGLATDQTSIILCGDPKQLGPVIKLDVSKDLQNKFTSALHRYMEMKVYQKDKRLCCQLVNCFRCPKAIVAIVSVLFYNQSLVGTLRKQDTFAYEKLGMTKKFPILFISTSGRECSEPHGFSFCNKTEAEICAKYIQYLVDQGIVSPEQIGVISPYNYQNRIITSELKSKHVRGWDKIVVNSVERFQGSEREVILMTATRTQNLGFIADDLRVNTSLTRAKKLLIVIGNRRALYSHASWRRFIIYCEKMESVKHFETSKDVFIGSQDQ